MPVHNADIAAVFDEIDALNRTLDGIVLLKGIEVDILDDGRLDLPDSVLGRLDLNDQLCRMAKAEGVRIAIDSDAHDVQDFGDLRYGIGQARRGWLGKDDVLNARPLRAIKTLIARKRRTEEAV